LRRRHQAKETAAPSVSHRLWLGDAPPVLRLQPELSSPSLLSLEDDEGEDEGWQYLATS